MKKNAQMNLIMTAATAVVLVAVNLGVFMAAKNGAIVAIDNMLLWGAFVALNVASILWAVSMLGLQPLVVAVSYVAGGVLAFQGVRGMSGVAVAEVTTAGATYGAFGVLAVGNAMTRVRLAFFNKGQVPFVFIIIGLLVLDAVLNSGISGASGSVYLNAVVLPFTIAGIVVGVIWSTLNRFGIGRNPKAKPTVIEEEEESFAEEATEAAATEKLVIRMPEAAAVEEEAEAEEPEEVVAPAAEEAEPAIEEVPAEAAELEPIIDDYDTEEEFFPLEIDKDEELVLPVEGSNLKELADAVDEAEEEEPVSLDLSSYNEDFYAADMDAEAEGVAVEVTAEAPVSEAEPEPAEKESGNGLDWLEGHMDLLNKLK
jgi:hypothetical protein